jgi:hypothetical protein
VILQAVGDVDNFSHILGIIQETSGFVTNDSLSEKVQMTLSFTDGHITDLM